MFASIARQVRPAQPPAEPEHRPALAAVHDADGPARAGGSRARLLHRDRRPGPGLPPGGPGPVAGRRRRLLPRDAPPGQQQGPQGRGVGARDRSIEGDTQRLPLPDDTFGVVTVAFGLRNVSDTVRGIDEMIRVARPGGKVAILEFSRPRGPLLGRLYLVFFRHDPAPDRPGDRPERRRCLPLPADQRAAVPRRPGDARPARPRGA